MGRLGDKRGESSEKSGSRIEGPASRRLKYIDEWRRRSTMKLVYSRAGQKQGRRTVVSVCRDAKIQPRLTGPSHQAQN